jgi:hypothetical protein
MDQEQIDKLRAAGYSDEDIRDYIANQPKAAGVTTQTQAESLPEVDVTKPSDTLTQAQQAGIPAGARESGFWSDVATAAPVVLAEHAGKVALGGLGAGALGAGAMYKRGKAMELEAERLRQQGIQNRFDARMAAQEANAARATQAAQAAKPIAPSPILDAAGRPMAPSVQPVAPGATPMAQGAQMAEQAAVRAPSILDKTTSMIRQLAANKVMQGLAKGANVLGAAQLAAYSPELGPPVPQVGRMRGMEINPMTGRPWTPEQLRAYNANPQQFDTALGAAQMPR